MRRDREVACRVGRRGRWWLPGMLLALLGAWTLVVLVVPAEVEAQGTLGLRTLKPGMWGEDVFELQRLLIRVGFDQPVTGNYGERTTASVRQLQRYAGLATDGVAGPATVSFLRQMAERPRYRVRPGDTLYDLSLRFGVSMTSLVDVNLLGDTTLRPGQELVIPDHWIYPVRQGDTLSGIAKRFGVGLERLERANRLDGATLSVGEPLWIPLPDW